MIAIQDFLRNTRHCSLKRIYFVCVFQEKNLKGLSWGVGAVGNVTWSGARLCDVLKSLGVDEEKYNHVQVSFYTKNTE